MILNFCNIVIFYEGNKKYVDVIYFLVVWINFYLIEVYKWEIRIV